MDQSPKQLQKGEVAEFNQDCEIIRSILNGDKDQFAILQKKYQRQISSLLRRMVRNPDDVQDLVQETFVKAYRALASFQCEHSFEKWLYKIASNSCIDYLRRKRFQMASLDSTFTNSDGSESSIEYEDPDSPQPDSFMLASEKTVLLAEALETLPPKYREVIRLRHEEELDYNEIAEKLDLPLGTVKAHIFRARQHLLKRLKKHAYLFDRDVHDDDELDS